MANIFAASPRNDCGKASVSEHETGEPFYAPKGSDSEQITMGIGVPEGRLCDLGQRAAIIEAETRRLAGEVTYGVDEARRMLKNRHVRV